MTRENIIYCTKAGQSFLPLRVLGAAAVLAWLVLAGSAFAQGTNQWAPAPILPPTSPQAQNTTIWAPGPTPSGPVFAPLDLDQRLENAANPAPDAALPAPMTPVAAAPIQPVAPFGSGWGGQPSGSGWSGQPYGSGWGGQPFGSGWSGQPFGSGWGGQSFGGPSSNFGNWGSPYNSFTPHGGVPFFGTSPFGFW